MAVYAFTNGTAGYGVLTLALLVLHVAIFSLPMKLPAFFMFFILGIPFLILIFVNFFVWLFCLCCKDNDEIEDDDAVARPELPVERWGEQSQEL